MKEHKIENKIITLHELRKAKRVIYLTGTKDATKLYILEFEKKKQLVHRIGKCDYKSCKGACCKFIAIDKQANEYYRNFGKKGKDSNIIQCKCNQLCKNNKCKLWNKKLPRACKQFPHPQDSTYWAIIDKCKFKFEILEEWKI